MDVAAPGEQEGRKKGHERREGSMDKRWQLKLLAAAKSRQSCPTLCDPIDGSPPGSPRPWDSPGKNTGVGCQFLLQCMKVKSESEVAQSCPTQRPHGLKPTRLLHPWDFPGKSTGYLTKRKLISVALNIAWEADWGEEGQQIYLLPSGPLLLAVHHLSQVTSLYICKVLLYVAPAGCHWKSQAPFTRMVHSNLEILSRTRLRTAPVAL